MNSPTNSTEQCRIPALEHPLPAKSVLLCRSGSAILDHLLSRMGNIAKERPASVARIRISMRMESKSSDGSKNPSFAF
jgi:hypothetical protein